MNATKTKREEKKEGGSILLPLLLLLGAAGAGIAAIAWGKRPAGEVSVDSVTVSPKTVYPAGEVDISVVVTNHAAEGEAKSATITLSLTSTGGGDSMDKTVTLQPGETKQLVFTYVAPSLAEGEALRLYTATANPGNKQDTFTVVRPPTADITVDSLSVSPKEVQPGDTVDIAVQVTNHSTVAGEITISVDVSPM